MKRGRAILSAMGVVTPRAVGLRRFTELLLPSRRLRAPGDAEERAEKGLDAAPPEQGDDRASRSAAPWFADRAGSPLERIEALAATAMDEALEGLDDHLRSRAVLVGGLGITETTALRGGPNIRPMLANLARRFKLGGPQVTTYTACATGTDALGLAFTLIQTQDVDCAVVVAADCPDGAGIRGAFGRLGVLARDRPELPAACRAFAADRDGFVLSEGAACLVLRRVARDLSAPESAIFVDGYGSSVDCFGPTTPDPEGSALARAIGGALRSAGISPDEVDVVSAHGTGTVHNDASEARALHKALPSAIDRIPVVATKALLGHSIAAAGLVETVAAVVGMQHGVLHANPHLVTPDLSLAIDAVGPSGREFPHRTVLKCSTAFGGNNAAIILRRGQPGDCGW